MATIRPDLSLVLSEDVEPLFSLAEADNFRMLAEQVGVVHRKLADLVVRTQAECTSVHDLLAEAKRAGKQIEIIRRKQVDPLNEQVKAYNAAWRPLMDAITAFEVAAKRKVTAFMQAERERVAREQEAARKRQEEAWQREQAALAKAETARSSTARAAALAKADTAAKDMMVARAEEPMQAPTGIKTDHGTSSLRRRWTFRVEFPDQLPLRFLVPDEKAIRKAVAEGARSIPGVVIYEEEDLAVRL